MPSGNISAFEPRKYALTSQINPIHNGLSRTIASVGIRAENVVNVKRCSTAASCKFKSVTHGLPTSAAYITEPTFQNKIHVYPVVASVGAAPVPPALTHVGFTVVHVTLNAEPSSMPSITVCPAAKLVAAGVREAPSVTI